MNPGHRIVFCADQPDRLGGVQRVIRTLADGLTDRGHHVTLLGLEPADPPAPLPTRNRLAQATALAAPTTLPYEPATRSRRARLALRGHWGGLARHHRSLARLRALLDPADAPTTIVLTQLRAAEHVLQALRPWPAHTRRRVRLIGQYHDACHAAAANGDLTRLRRLRPHLDDLLVLNEGDAAQFRAAGIPVAVLRNPVDPTAPPARPRAPLVVTGARYAPQKALDVLLRAWAALAPAHPEWRLELYGEGPDQAELHTLIDTLGIADSATLRGPTDDFAAVLAAASICALSSRHEGMGLVLAEAMAAGTPCVATDAGPGVRELIDPGRTGLLTPVGDAPALARALEHLMRDPAERERLAAAARIRLRRFAVEAVLDDWETLLNRGAGD